MNTRIALVAAALFAAPAAGYAQEGQPATASAAEAGEAAQLRQRIAQLHQQALTDPSVKPVQDSLNTAIQDAMARLDPAAPGKAARATSLNQEVEAARAAGDNAKLNQLADEATQLKAYFDNLRPRAMEDARVQAARQVYLARVFERMKQIDPNAQQYVDRLNALKTSSGGSQ